MWTSVQPLAVIRICQGAAALPAFVAGWALASIPPAKVPTTGDQGGLVTPEGGVANAMPPYTATPTRPRTRVKSHFGFTVSPLVVRCLDVDPLRAWAMCSRGCRRP